MPSANAPSPASAPPNRWFWPLFAAALLSGLLFVLVVGGFFFRVVNGAKGERDEVALPDPTQRLRLPRDLAEHPGFLYESRRIAGWLKNRAGQKFAFSMRLYRDQRRVRDRWWWRRTQSPPGRVELLIADYATEQNAWLERDCNQPSVVARDDGRLVLGADDWRVTLGGVEMAIVATGDNAAMTLNAVPEKKPVLYGSGGYHWRGADGAPSYFLGYPRLALDGQFVRNGVRIEVTGSGFLDHEFTSYRLPATTAGVDRLTLQLDNQHELTLLRLRRRDGSISADSPLSLVLPDGDVIELDARHFELTPTRHWRSEDSRGNYPIAWRLAIPQYQAELELSAPVPESEQRRRLGRDAIWLGPLTATGQWGGWKVRGHGFADLTGYAP